MFKLFPEYVDVQDLVYYRVKISKTYLIINLIFQAASLAHIPFFGFHLATLLLVSIGMVLNIILLYDLRESNYRLADSVMAAFSLLSSSVIVLQHHSPFDLILLGSSMVYILYFSPYELVRKILIVLLVGVSIHGVYLLCFDNNFINPATDFIAAGIGNIVVVFVYIYMAKAIFDRYNLLVLTSSQVALDVSERHVTERLYSRNLIEKKRVQLLKLGEKISDRLRLESQSLAELKARNEQLEQFAYAASHDLKEPVRTINSFMQVARRNLGDSAAEGTKIGDYFNHVEHSTKTMNRLLERILSYSRLDRYQPKFERINLGDLCQQACSRIENTLPNGSKVSIEVDDRIFIHTDIKLFSTILDELLSNSAKFIDNRLKPKILVLVNLAEGLPLKISVIDNGLGIDHEYHTLVFGLFKRLHRRELFPGSGVGLSIAKRAADLIDGSILLESREGSPGSIFTLSLQQ